MLQNPHRSMRRDDRKGAVSASEAAVRAWEESRVKLLWKAIRSFSQVSEPFWVFGAAVGVYLCVYLSFLRQAETPLVWLGVAVTAFPLFGRLLRYGYHAVRTPFDLPLGLLAVGMVVGLAGSPDFKVSLGAFQTFLAASFLYYSFCAYRRVGTLLKASLPVAGFIILSAALFAGAHTPQSLFNYLAAPWLYGLLHSISVFPQTLSDNAPSFTLNYGLAFALLMVFAFCGGFALFGKGVWLRLGTGFAFLLSGVAIVLFFYTSIGRLATGISLTGRMDYWQVWIGELKKSPLTGLGLGAGPLVLLPTIGRFYHPHNAYLELYGDTGVLGLLALLAFLVIGLRLAWGILRSPDSLWRGIGMGIVGAGVASALFGIIEKAPIGHFVFGDMTYVYMFSPAPWLLGTALVAAHRLARSPN